MIDTAQSPSSRARRRFSYLTHLHHFRNARLTCREFGISPTTLYLWKNRFKRNDKTSLQDHQRGPRHKRQPTWSYSSLVLLGRILENNPSYRLVDIVRFFQKEGVSISLATASRIRKKLTKTLAGSHVFSSTPIASEARLGGAD